MKAVVIGAASGASMDEIMKVFPRPFILEGLIESYAIREWHDQMLG